MHYKFIKVAVFFNTFIEAENRRSQLIFLANKPTTATYKNENYKK